MDIKPTDISIRNLLESGFYKIPRFQRPYSWAKPHVEDFWDDAITSEDRDYFIGSFVLYPESANSDTYMVVDGQQRLTTITILLAAIRNELDNCGFKDLAQGLQQRIETKDIDNNLRFILISETSYPFLQEHIQKYGQAELPLKTGPEELALQGAFDLLSEKVKSVTEAVDADASIGANRKNKAKREKLLEIRDKVLRLQLISVQLTNENDAYLIFETLNTRGMNLGVSDLLKNHLTRLLRPKNKGVDVASDKWRKVRSVIEESAADLDINRFIYHSWISRNPYIGQAKLFAEIKKRIKKANAMSFLDNLVSDVQCYRRVLEPNSHAWKLQDREIRNSLRALNGFRVLQPVPLTLSILRSYESGDLTANQTRHSLSCLEKFHAQFTGVTSQPTGGGTARMYAASAEDLSEASNKNARAQILKEFVFKLRERVPSYEEFQANILEIFFAADSTRDKSIVQYLLRKIDEHLRPGAIPDYETMSIEHIAPQKPSGANAIVQTSIGALGNLILIPEKLNVDAANSPFMTKKKLFIKHHVPMDPYLKNAKRWSDRAIVIRTQELTKLLYTKVLKV